MSVLVEPVQYPRSVIYAVLVQDANAFVDDKLNLFWREHQQYDYGIIY